MDLWTAYWSYIVGALIVLAVLVLLFVVVRSLGGRVRGGKGARLGISEYYEIDKDRRLVLVRRDDVEHLMLIGGAQDVVIESGIPLSFDRGFDEGFDHPPMRADAGRGAPHAPAEDPVTLRAAPRPPVFGEKRPGLRTVERGEPQLRNPDRDYGPDDRV